LDEKFLLKRISKVSQAEINQAVMEKNAEVTSASVLRKASALTEIVRPPLIALSQDLTGFSQVGPSVLAEEHPNEDREDYHGSVPGFTESTYLSDKFQLDSNLADLEVSSSPSPSDQPQSNQSTSSSTINFTEDNKSDFHGEAPRSRKSTLTASLALARKQTPETTEEDRLRRTCRKAYEPAFSLLHTLETKPTPGGKLQVIRNLADEICKCVDRAYAHETYQEEKIQIGTDDLIVLFAYMMIQANCVSVLTDLEFVEDFVSQRIRNGMDEYYLSTIRAAAKLISTAASSLLIVDEDEM